MPTSIGLVWSGGLVLIASWLMTGCRFGNRLEYAEPKTLTGYYETAPTHLSFCAQLGTGTATVCHTAETNQVPSIAGGVFSNPVAFQMLNETTGAGMLIGLPDRVAVDVMVRVNTNQFSLGFTIPDPIIPYVQDGCNVTMDWDGSGIAAKTTRRVVGSYEVKGRIELVAEITTTFSGACQALKNQLLACYQNELQCNGDSASRNRVLHDRVRQALDPFVAAGVITPAQITSVQALAFQLTYQ